jgi:hypothetical protein
MQMGNGLCFVDPHGDAAQDLLACVPKERVKDVVYFDPASPHCPSFNILRAPFPPYKLAEDIVAVMQILFDATGPRMEHVTRYALLSLLHDSQPRTLRDLRRLLTDPNFRSEVLSQIQDEDILDFWNNEFPKLPKDVAAPIINKFSSFLLPGSPMLRMFSQKENDLDFSSIMNSQKIFIVNLSKGLLGEIPSRILGALIVTGIMQSGLARQELLPAERKDFHLYLDEFQNFIVASSFESILSEAAKYKLYLTLAHQTLGQVPSSLQACIFGNVATLVAFGISAADAQLLRREMHQSRFTYRALQSADYRPLAELIDSERAALQEKIAGCYRLDEQAKSEPPTSGLNQATRGRAAIRQAAEERLQQLSVPALPLAYLREFFPDYEFKETDFPDVDDFINLQPRHAFVRLERAENVCMIRTVAPPEPDTVVRSAILYEMQQTHQARQKHRVKKEEFLQPEPVQAESPPNGLDTQVPPPAAKEPEAEPVQEHPAVPKKPPKTDEDFEF